MDSFWMFQSKKRLIVAYVMYMFFSKTSNLKLHHKTHSHSIARSAHTISNFNTQYFKSQDALTPTRMPYIGQSHNYMYVLPVALLSVGSIN